MKIELISIIFCTGEIFSKAAAESNENESCEAEGFDCTSNNQCCSDYCEMDSADKFGVCKQACGTAITSDEKLSEDEEYPWTAEILGLNLTFMFMHRAPKMENALKFALYSRKCYGTLISHTALISAASCFVVQGVPSGKIYRQDLLNLRVAFKKHGKFDQSNIWAQISEVKNVDFSPELEESLHDRTVEEAESGERDQKFLYYVTDDIVILTLKTEVDYTRDVRPICVDIGPHDFEKQQLVPGQIAKLGCIKDTTLDRNPGDVVLRDFVLIEKGECRDKLWVDINYERLTPNQICLRYNSTGFVVGKLDYTIDYNNIAEAATDSWLNKFVTMLQTKLPRRDRNCTIGEGVMFQDAKTKKYYLRAVRVYYESMAYGSGQARVTLHKKLSAHKDMVEKYLDNCKRVCRRSCGKSNSIQSTKKQTAEEFPWDARIYEFNATTGTYDLICGGTLISHTVVISAASCFTIMNSQCGSSMYDKCAVEREKNPSTLKVALGKHYRNLNASRNELFDVESYEYSPEYTPKYANDIIFVTLKTAVEYTKDVQPVCIDFGSANFEKEHLIKGAVGKAVAWNLRGEKVNNGTVEEMRYGTIGECLKVFDQTELAQSLICAGNKSRDDDVRLEPTTRDSGYDYNLCLKYHGKGLVFEDSKTKMYYLRGVGAMNWVICTRGLGYYPFTTLSSQKELLEKYVEDCNRGCRQNLCEPLTSEKLNIICLLPTGQSTNCDRPLSSNSRAIFACNSVSYAEIQRSKYNIINCINGRWDRPLVDEFCVPAYPECGKPVSSSIQSVVIYGKEVKYGDFPWHVGIYEYNSQDSSYQQICGGTLISHTVVVSAAHCFTVDEKGHRNITIKNLSTLRVGLGKYRRTLDASGDALAQIVDIQHIEIPTEYRSHISQYAYDIAFVTLKTKINYTRAVQPICIDAGPSNFEKDQLIRGAMGKVVGWGLNEGGKPSENLTLAEMGFVPREECIKNISSGLLGFVKHDKLCAGNLHTNATVCRGDSGGGLVFEDPVTKKYYLRGVVSLGNTKCRGPDFSLFTRLSFYEDLLAKYLRLESGTDSPDRSIDQPRVQVKETLSALADSLVESN